MFVQESIITFAITNFLFEKIGFHTIYLKYKNINIIIKFLHCKIEDIKMRKEINHN